MQNIYSSRLRRVRAALAGRGLDGVLVTGPENRRYLSGFRAEDHDFDESSGALLILRREAMLLTDGRYEAQARQEAPGWPIVVYRQGLAPALKELISQARGRRLAFEPRYLAYEAYGRLKKALPDVELLSLEGRIEAMRAEKSPDEVVAIRKAIAVAEAIFDEVWQSLRPGVNEKEVAWRILEGLHKQGYGSSFPPIVASGPNAALPHAVPTNRRIREGEPVIIDMGAKVDGYCSDMTRTAFLGAPADPFRKVYSVVRKAQRAAQESLYAGVTGRRVDAVARRIIEKAGYGPFFAHSLGHGVGLAIHEAPSLSIRARRSLRPGMVVTVEPGIYLPGQGGVRLENMVLVEVDGATVLSQDRWYYEF